MTKPAEWSMDNGRILFRVPWDLAPVEVDEIEEWLQLAVRTLRRRAEQAEAARSAPSESPPPA